MELRVQFLKESDADLVFSVHETIYLNLHGDLSTQAIFTLHHLLKGEWCKKSALTASPYPESPNCFSFKLPTKIPARDSEYYLQVECGSQVCNSRVFKVSKTQVKVSISDHIVENYNQGTRVWLQGVFPSHGRYQLEVAPIGAAKLIFEPQELIGPLLKFTFSLQDDIVASLVLICDEERKDVRTCVSLSRTETPETVTNAVSTPLKSIRKSLDAHFKGHASPKSQPTVLIPKRRLAGTPNSKVESRLHLFGEDTNANPTPSATSTEPTSSLSNAFFLSNWPRTSNQYPIQTFNGDTPTSLSTLEDQSTNNSSVASAVNLQPTLSQRHEFLDSNYASGPELMAESPAFNAESLDTLWYTQGGVEFGYQCIAPFGDAQRMEYEDDWTSAADATN